MQPSHGNSQYFLGVYPIIYPVYHACHPSPNTNSECIVSQEHHHPPCPPPPNNDEPHNIKGYSSFGGISFKFDRSYGISPPVFTDVSGGYFRIDTSNLQTIKNIQLSSNDSSYDANTSSSYSSYFSAVSPGNIMILYNVSNNTSIIYQLTANPSPLFGGSSYAFAVSYKSGKITLTLNQNDLYIITFTGGANGSFTNLIPPASNVYTLGSPEFPWKDLYLGSNSLYIDQFKMSVNADGNNLTVVDTISSNPNDIVFDFNKINTLTAPSTIVSTIAENIRTGGLLQHAVLSTVAESITTPQSLIQSALVSTISTILNPINVNKIIAGPNIKISPTNGVGVVTISSSVEAGPIGPTGQLGQTGLIGSTGPTGLAFIPTSTITNVNNNMPFYVVNKSIIPDTDSVYDLGATGLAFRSGHFNVSTIYLGSTSVSTDSLGNIIFTNSSGDVSYGPTGPTGLYCSQIYSGTGPTGPTGHQNDLYLNTTTSDLYQYNDSIIYTLDSNSYVTTIPLTLSNGPISRVYGFAKDRLGNLYASTNANIIMKIDSSGNCSVFAGAYTAAPFYNFSCNPVIDSNGNLYISDYNKCVILKIDPSGNVTDFAGNRTRGHLDGNGTNATFGEVACLAIDKNDNIYVGDENVIRKIDSSANVSTYVGNASIYTNILIPGNGINGILPENTFPQQGFALAVDNFGNLYGSHPGRWSSGTAAPFDNYLIFKVDTNRNLSAYIPDKSSIPIYQDGPIATAEFGFGINFIVFDSNNNMYVGDYGNNLIRKIDTSDNVTTFAGTKNARSNLDGPVGTATWASQLYGGYIDSNNNIYTWQAVNQGARSIRLINASKSYGEWTPLLNIGGPTGATGLTGPTGPIGETGAYGPRGSQGYTVYTYIISMTIASAGTIVGATVNNLLLPDGNTIVGADSFGNFILPSVLGGGTVTTLIDGTNAFTISFPASSNLTGLFTNFRRYASTTSGKGSIFSYSEATGSSQIVLIPNTRTIKFLNNTSSVVGYVGGSVVYFAFDYMIDNTGIVPWEVPGF